VLEHLAAAGQPQTLGNLSQALGIPKSSLHAILNTMARRGWLQTDSDGLRFQLGVRALLVGSSYVDSDDVVSRTSATLDGLADEIGETIHLGRLDGADIVYLAKRESRHQLRLFSAVGRRLPAHATALGKCVLAWQDDPLATLPAVLPQLTKHTIIDREELLRDLEAIKARGYAIDDEENTPGIRCIAVPIRRGGVVSDAISCSVPLVRLDHTVQGEIIAAMQRAQRDAEAFL
tara:strand:+ start:430 stop:1128 length:699 start_codon:yes stop_codon:yes gene_type:complete